MDETAKKQRRNKGWDNIIPHQIKPGEVRNPKGRPKKESCLTSVLKEELGKVPSKLPDGTRNTKKLTNAQILGAQAIEHAVRGNQAYYKEILDRVVLVKRKWDHCENLFIPLVYKHL